MKVLCNKCKRAVAYSGATSDRKGNFICKRCKREIAEEEGKNLFKKLGFEI